MGDFEFEIASGIRDASQQPPLLDLVLIEEFVAVVGDYLISVAVILSSALSTSAHFTRIRDIDTGVQGGVQQFLVFGYLDLGRSVLVQKHHPVRSDVALALIETSCKYSDSDTTHYSQQAATFLVRQIPRGCSACLRVARRLASAGALSLVHTFEITEAPT